jgi:DNA-binding beta-propeller fold protein YncE
VFCICDVGGSRVARTDAEGGNADAPVKLENQCQGVAVDPKTGDIYATTNNSKSVYKFSAAGVGREAFESADALGFLRFDRQGNLCGAGSHVLRFDNGKAALEIAEAAGDDLYTKGFDVDALSGSIWIASGLEKDRSLYRGSADGKSRQKVAGGADWRLGRVDVPQSVRIDAQGNAYVAELGEADTGEAARVSVFDKSGALVRVFGRGGRTPDPSKEKIITGQVGRPTDLAFGANGRVYVAQENDGGFSKNLMLMFEPF